MPTLTRSDVKLYCERSASRSVWLASSVSDTLRPTFTAMPMAYWFSPVGSKLLALYPDPNTTTSGSVPWQNNFIAKDNIREWRLNSVIARLDHNVGPRLRLMGRFAWNDFVQLTNNNGLPGVAGNYRYGSKANKQNIVLDAVATLTPSTILNIRGSMNHWVGDFKPYVPFDPQSRLT